MSTIAATWIIGAWYASTWLKNGWWLFLILPALAVAATVITVAIDASGIDASGWDTFGLVLAADALEIHVGWLVGLPIGATIATVICYRKRRASAIVHSD